MAYIARVMSWWGPMPFSTPTPFGRLSVPSLHLPRKQTPCLRVFRWFCQLAGGGESIRHRSPRVRHGRRVLFARVESCGFFASGLEAATTLRLTSRYYVYLRMCVWNDNRELCESYLKTFARLFTVLQGWPGDGKHKLRLPTSQAVLGLLSFQNGVG